MVIIHNILCDGCQKILEEGDMVYCRECFENMREKIFFLRERIEELEKENTRLAEQMRGGD